MSVPDWMIDTPSPSLDDMATLIRRLVRGLRKAAPSNDLADKAMDYLKRMGLDADVMRAVATPVQVAPAPTDMSQLKTLLRDYVLLDEQRGDLKDALYSKSLALLGRLGVDVSEFAAPVQVAPNQAAEDARDAARYRFLRSNPLDGKEWDWPYIHAAEDDGKHWALTFENADGVIDDAMTALSTSEVEPTEPTKGEQSQD